MIPAPYKKFKQADISWNTVWITESERNELAQKVMDSHMRGEQALRAHDVFLG